MRSLLVTLALAAALALPTVASARPAGPIGSAFAGHSSPSTTPAQRQALIAGATVTSSSQPHALADTVEPATSSSPQPHALADTVEPATASTSQPHALADTVEPTTASTSQPHALADTVRPSRAAPAAASSSDGTGSIVVIALIAGGVLVATAAGLGGARLRPRSTVSQS